MKVLVIGNPVSGGGKARAQIEVLGQELAARGHAAEIFLTEKEGDAAGRARGVDGDVERVVVVGGDGTLNEVVNGLTDPGRVPIAQLPTGTANILAHDLGFPTKPSGTAALIDQGEVRRIDMGLIGERRFLMVVSAGFDAMVTQYIREHRTGQLGYRGYVKPVLQVIKDYVPAKLSVTVDNEPPVACEGFIASSTRNYGGFFRISDEARPDSGQLHVCIIEKASIRNIIKLGVAGLLRGFAKHPNVVYRTGRRVRVCGDEIAPVEIDGDYAGTTPIDIELLPGAIPIMVPANSK